MNETKPIIDSVEALETELKRLRNVQTVFAGYTQEQVDKLIYEAGKIIYKNAAKLAEMAVNETGLGDVNEKILKNEETGAVFWEYLKDKKSVGIINPEPDEDGLIKVAHPVGVIAAITPATNPTITPLGNFMQALKGKNAMIVSPAPRAQKTSYESCMLIREALVANGAPADLLQCLEDVTIQKSQELMAECDLVVATGSMGLTKAAYSSGTPAYGVGPGNPPVIIDRGYDLKDAAENSIIAVASDNGILCDGDNLLLYPQDLEAEFFEEFRKAGAVVFDNADDVAKFRDALFENGKVRPGLVGKDTNVIAEAAGYNLPEGTKVIGLKIEGVGKDDILGKEIMGPVVVLKSYDKFEDAVDMAIRNMEEDGGTGHTAGIYSNDEDHILYFGEKIPVARVLVNQPTPDAWGPETNALSPAVSEGCGTWGNNILAGNVDYIHMVNVSKIVKKLDVEPLDPAKVFAD